MARLRANSCRLLPLVLLLLAATAHAQISIDAVGGWSDTINSADLQGGAGSDLISSHESTTNAGTLTISGATGDSDVWRVDVRRSDTTWHNDFTLSVKRTGTGTGGGSISGGTAYQAVGTTNAEFFSGAGDRSNVPLQFKLDGVSVQVPPDSYSTTITCTVVDIL